MKLDQRKLSIVISLIYIISVLFVAYTLITLQNDLVYGSQALDVSQISSAQPVLIKLYVASGISILIGLGLVYFFFNNKSMEIIYVEKKDDKKKKTDEDENKKNEDKKLDFSSIKDITAAQAKSEEKILTHGLTEVCKNLEAGAAAYYTVRKDGEKKVLQMNATYAMSLGESQRPTFEFGEGLVGQVAVEQNPINLDDIPEGYIKIISGLGSASPTHVLICPVKYGEELCGVVEIASFTKFSKQHIEAVNEAFKLITGNLYGKASDKKEAPKVEEPKEEEEKKPVKKAAKSKGTKKD